MGAKRAIALLMSSQKLLMNISIILIMNEFNQKQNGCRLQSIGKHPIVNN